MRKQQGRLAPRETTYSNTLLEKLLEILALKVEAGALSRPATGTLARQALRRALAEERELASLAERNGREL